MYSYTAWNLVTSGLGMVAQTDICPPMPIVTFAVMTFLGASECLEWRLHHPVPLQLVRAVWLSSSQWDVGSFLVVTVKRRKVRSSPALLSPLCWLQCVHVKGHLDQWKRLTSGSPPPLSPCYIYISDPLLRAPFLLYHNNLWRRPCCCSHVTDEHTEAQRNDATSKRQNWDFNPGNLIWESMFFSAA